MKSSFFKIILTLLLVSSCASAAELQDFLKNCAYGTLAGAMVGVMSLALSDKPSDHSSNIAKGASLGLYAGIGYGLVKLNEKPAAPNVDPYASLAPLYQEGRLDGAKILVNLSSF